jgi:hypothetical protein
LYLLLFRSSVSKSFLLPTLTWQQQTRCRRIHHRRRFLLLHAVEIDGYDEAFRIIDACAARGESSDELYSAVRFVERNAYRIYPDLSHKHELWEKAHGSWKLVLSTGGAKNRHFHKPPAFLPFSFAMIAEKHFGNGIGLNENTIWLSLLHTHYFNAKIRQMVVIVTDCFLFGTKVTSFLPAFVRNALNIGRTPEDFVAVDDEKPPPTFVIIGATDKSLVARGNQSGGLAIWTRLSQDIRTVAYKE